ncbi:Transcriptional regulator, AraC family [Indibacter alkaliphilus LW1]|uniref:Transcriptional regulator, AraC family n=1 Tax=Indibacter alkaliphilus (strain CCUG 57479 / KCTC 22604 / LW1) TaxID=1189612 RepID=S2DIA0_INDAL|nr:AraC family transcriptional regulator [Indibacter alkaliphilus]EOZ98744.1 Transcriptional regulator, AraC family [Indibacter alkaliphilus LW1]
MDFSLINPKQSSPLDLSAKVRLISSKPNLQELALNFSDINYGLVDCKVLATPNLSLMFGNIQLQPNIKLKSETPENSVNFPFLLEGEIASRFYSYPQKQLLTANSHNAIHLTQTEGEHHLPLGKVKTFHISLGSDYFFDTFSSEDKVTETLKNSIDIQRPEVASTRPGHLNAEMKWIISSITNNPFEGDMKKMYLEIKTLELISLQLYQLDNIKRLGRERENHQDLAYAVRSFLESDITATWTLVALAKKFGTNIQTLKTSFKAEFDTGIFAYYQHLRMDHALNMLKDQKNSIVEVSEWLGYSHQNHFSAAFKKHFGYPPSEALKR